MKKKKDIMVEDEVQLIGHVPDLGISLDFAGAIGTVISVNTDDTVIVRIRGDYPRSGNSPRIQPREYTFWVSRSYFQKVNEQPTWEL